ncbi:MAG: NusG domain II-containing protein [Eubacteriales bacterium]
MPESRKQIQTRTGRGTARKLSQFVCPGDLIVYGILITLTVLSVLLPFLFSAAVPESDEALNVRIQCGDTVSVYPLSEPREIVLENRGYTVRVVIENASVSVADSTCRDKICVSSGKADRAGEVIVCLPAHILIAVEGGSVDADIILG